MNRHVSLAKRLKFFDACVSPSMLFALVSLPLTRAQIEELDILQRKMIRRIVGWRRVEDEPWEITMRRMGNTLDNARNLYDWKDWSYRFARDQWRFAVHLACTDISMQKMAMLQHTWHEVHDPEGLYVPRRFIGRPRIKWDDRLDAFFLQHFPSRSSEHWSDIIKTVGAVRLEEDFINFTTSS